MKGDRGMKMQPGDWIAKEDIRDEEHLERIRGAVRAQGWRVGSIYGVWMSPARISRANRLVLNESGDLLWTPEDPEGRRIDPADLLPHDHTLHMEDWARRVGNPVGHPAAGILQQIADEARVNPEPWREFEWRVDRIDDWKQCVGLTDVVHAAEEYQVRRRPRTIRIGEYDVPVSLREPLEDDTRVWVADLCHPNFCFPLNYCSVSEYCERALQRGLIHIDPEAAAIHGRALVSLTVQERSDD